MEIIKARRYILIVLLLFAISFLANSQTFDEVKNAFSKSYTFEFEGKYSDAIHALKNVYQEDNYPLNLRLGWLNYSNGNFTESLTYYNSAIQLKPYSIEPRFGLVYPAAALGNWNLVKEQYIKILEIDPNNTLANYRMGMIYYGYEDYQTAFSYFEKVINLYPFDYDSLLMFAWSNFKLGKLREAEVIFKQVLLFSPDDESALEGLSLIK